MRTGPATALGSLVLLLGTTGAAPAGAAVRQELRGTSRITTTTSVVVPVRMARPVTLSHVDDYTERGAPPNPHITITGKGRVIGVVLTQNGARPRGSEGATLAYLRYGMCPSPGCDPGADALRAMLAVGDGVSRAGNGDVRLPKGDYDLHVIADGAPVQVVLRLPATSGSVELRPAGRSGAEIAAAASDGVRYTASSRHTFAGRGMIAVSATTRGDVTTGPTGGFCIVHEHERGGPEPTDPADAPSACFSRVPTAAIRQAQGGPQTGFHGGNAGRRFTGGDIPGGQVQMYVSFDPGVYSVGHSWLDTVDNRAVAYTTVAVPWR